MAELIPMFKVFMPHDASRAVSDTLYSGYLAEGPKVKKFEEALGHVVGTRRVLAMNSCTSAITLALRIAGVGPGDEVITTPMTCTATNLPILTAGARPLWADVDPLTGLIDPGDVGRLLHGRKIRAVICVDWGGKPCDLNMLLAVTEPYGVPIIEDAAHALGATYAGRPVGGVSDMTCFSFQAIKHITTGDGGALTFGPKAEVEGMYNLARRLRWYGINRDVPAEDTRIDIDIEAAGYKFNMNDLAATLGLEALPHLRSVLRVQRETAHFYDLYLPRSFVRPYDSPESRSAWWLYTVLLPEAGLQKGFRKYMATMGVQVSQVHRRNDDYSVFVPYACSLPGLDKFALRMMCLPVHWGLTLGEREHIVEACEAWEGAGA